MEFIYQTVFGKRGAASLFWQRNYQNYFEEVKRTSCNFKVVYSDASGTGYAGYEVIQLMVLHTVCGLLKRDLNPPYGGS